MTLDDVLGVVVAVGTVGLLVDAIGPHFEHILHDVAAADFSQNTGGATLLD